MEKEIMGGPWEDYQPDTESGASGPWDDYKSIGQNAVSDIKGQALGLASNAVDMATSGGQSFWEKPMAMAAQTGADLITGKPLSETPFAGAIKAAKDTASRIGNEIIHPVESFKQHPVNTGIDLVGTAAGLGEGIASETAPAFAEKVGAIATNPEAARIATENPELLKNIPSTEDLANRLPDIIEKINKQIGDHMDIAKDSLSSSKYLNDGAITKDEIGGLIGKARGELGGIYTSEGEKASKALGNLGEDLNKVHATISQKQAYDIMQKLDNEIPWEKIHSRPEDVTAEEWAMVDVRRGLRGLLGEKNPDFGAMMEPVSILEKDKGDLISKFGVKRDIEGTRPGDQTVSRLASALKENQKTAKPESERILENIKSSTGEDLITPLKLQAFDGPTSESPMGIPSRVGGGAAGAFAGEALGLKGAGLGALAGQRVLRQPMSVLGRNMASKMIQAAPGIAEREGQILPAVAASNMTRKNGIPQSILEYIKSHRNGMSAGGVVPDDVRRYVGC